jgi:hypothetical protein
MANLADRRESKAWKLHQEDQAFWWFTVEGLDES